MLRTAHHHSTYKRWIAHNVVQLMLGDHVRPLRPQGVPLNDVGIGFQRQKIQGHMYYVLGFLHHLALSDPQRRLCHSHGEIVDFDTVELADGDLNRVAHVQHDLPLMEKGYCFIFQPPEGDVSFRQEVAGAAGRVQEFQPRQLPLKGFQLGLAGPLHRDGFNLRKLGFQPIQE